MIVTRRTIVKGAAWSIPVIMAATAVPHAAASAQPGNACLRFIGSNFTRDGLKVKVQNQCGMIARDVQIIVSYENGQAAVARVFPQGELDPHAHAPAEHLRLDDIPDEISQVTVTVKAENADAVTEVFTR